MVYEFDGTKYEKLRDMQAARRAKYLDLVRGGMNFTQAAHAVGVSKRTGKVWRNGRTRSTGRNERPLVDWYRGDMDKPKRIDARYLCMDERIAIADMRRAGSGVRAIARALGRAPSTISRELRRNVAEIGGVYGPHRAQQMANQRTGHLGGEQHREFTGRRTAWIQPRHRACSGVAPLWSAAKCKSASVPIPRPTSEAARRTKCSLPRRRSTPTP